MKKTIVELFKELIATYGKNCSLFTFNLCADNGIELNGSTIDRIDDCGSYINFYYNENTNDYDSNYAFAEKDLQSFYTELKNVLSSN